MMLPLVALAAMAAPAMAQPAPSTRLVSRDGGDRLLVRGHRASPQAAVRINGRPVEVSGGTAWRIELPVATVREWSAGNARALHVTVGAYDAAGGDVATVRLPIGMLARDIELASLVVRAR
ncbi:hypothetical protein FOY91_02825 [Sphingomonas solaris]|uniref:Uncharacterized protein n=2 Tax=Alterirhizorhabdus solaris TaxID=2529389 RepID=A0A558RBZ0_9SPHN|nr:hypothetical protein FOY91_02825 [Sphingomonas solaris]